MAQGFAFGVGFGMFVLIVALLAIGSRMWLATRKPQRVLVVEDPEPEDDGRPEWMRRRVYDPFAGYAKRSKWQAGLNLTPE